MFGRVVLRLKLLLKEWPHRQKSGTLEPPNFHASYTAIPRDWYTLLLCTHSNLLCMIRTVALNEGPFDPYKRPLTKIICHSLQVDQKRFLMVGFLGNLEKSVSRYCCLKTANISVFFEPL